MVLRQNATRRRRIVIDPKNQGSEAGEIREDLQSPARKRKRTLYKAGAERRFQWKTTDLLPKRRLGFVTSIGLLLIALLGINLLYFYSDRWLNYVGTAGVSTLKLSGPSTLAAWFSSFLLIISGFASLQIYALRQHRQDDYRGSYRLWLWMAGVLLLASLNCVVDLTSIGTNLISSLTKVSFQTSLLGMVCLKVLLLTALVARGSYEVRESRTSLMLVVLVWIAYVAAATLQLPQMQPVMANLPQSTFQIAHGNLILFGTIFVFMAHLVFARFVYLQALGMIKQKVSKSRKRSQSTTKSKTKSKKVSSSSRSSKKKASSKSNDDTTEESTEDSAEDADDEASTKTRSRTLERLETKSQTHQPSGNAPKSNASKPQRHDRDADDESDASVLKLSKSEQRRQRKEQQSSSHRRAA